jgi:molybdopterin-guanine dinucleotide biosynthesis protein A
MQPAADSVAVVILAGGQATRFPGKLESDAGGVPLLLRVYRNIRAMGPVYLSANTPFGEQIARELDCPVIADSLPGRGPLGGLASTFEKIPQARCFAIAGDAPLLNCAALGELLSAWESGLEAVVAERDGRLEPLCGLYDRLAFLREAARELETGSGAVAAVVERLRHRRVRLCDERQLANINTGADRDAFLGIHS